MQKCAIFINTGLISENKVTNEKLKLSEKVSKKFQLTDTSQAAHAPTVHSLATCVPSEAAVPRPLPRPAPPCHPMCHVSCFVSCSVPSSYRADIPYSTLPNIVY